MEANKNIEDICFPSLSSIPLILQEYDFCLKWAIEVELTQTKAETIIKSFHIMKTTREKLSVISHHLNKSFFLWFLHTKYITYIEEAKKELKTAIKLCKEWEEEIRLSTCSTFYTDYLDGVDHVITGMKILLDPENYVEDFTKVIGVSKRPIRRAWAGVLHVKQEFFRPFLDEFDRRAAILDEIRKLNRKDSKACLYLAKTLGQKRKMENFLSAPSKEEMDLLVEGNKSARSKDGSILIELCYCLAQYVKNSTKIDYPVKFYGETLRFQDEKAIANFINKQTSKMWKEGHDAAPLYVKLAEIQSSLLPVKHRHPEISALALVNRALEKYKNYSKGLHRKGKILFKYRQYDEGIKCLEASFKCGETNCDALCDLVFRLMHYPNVEKLKNIFLTYCNDRGEDLWGKRKVGTMFYLFGCFLWMLLRKEQAVWYWLEAEKRNPNPTFYFEGLYKQKQMFRWHKAELLTFPDIIKYLRCVELNIEEDQYARDKLLAKLNSLLET